MSQPGQETNDPIVRRWRRTFLGVYLVFTVGAVVWTFLSIVAVNCGSKTGAAAGPRISPLADDPAELRACKRGLVQLLGDLHREAFALQARALRSEADLAAEWRNWSQAWRGRWQALDWRCRLGELAGKRRSAAIDAMAAIHGALDELRLSYGDAVERFVERNVERLRRLHEELSRVDRMIDRCKPAGKRQKVGGRP